MKSSNTVSRHGTSCGQAQTTVPPTWSDHLYVEIARSDIALFKFILESCDNLAYLSVLDKYRALVRLTYSPETRPIVEDLLPSLQATLTIRAWFSLSSGTTQTACFPAC